MQRRGPRLCVSDGNALSRFGALVNDPLQAASLCSWNYGEARQNPAIVIEPSDYIVGGDTNPIDVYSVLTHHGIKNVLHAGIAENICVQAKCEVSSHGARPTARAKEI